MAYNIKLMCVMRSRWLKGMKQKYITIYWIVLRHSQGLWALLFFFLFLERKKYSFHLHVSTTLIGKNFLRKKFSPGKRGLTRPVKRCIRSFRKYIAVVKAVPSAQHLSGVCIIPLMRTPTVCPCGFTSDCDLCELSDYCTSFNTYSIQDKSSILGKVDLVLGMLRCGTRSFSCTSLLSKVDSTVQRMNHYPLYNSIGIFRAVFSWVLVKPESM